MKLRIVIVYLRRQKLTRRNERGARNPHTRRFGPSGTADPRLTTGLYPDSHPAAASIVAAVERFSGLHCHDLRHEAGSRMLEAGWPLHHVQAVLGHADAKTTSGYLNATVLHLLDSMRRFGSGSQPLHDVAHGTESEPPPSGNDVQAMPFNWL